MYNTYEFLMMPVFYRFRNIEMHINSLFSVSYNGYFYVTNAMLTTMDIKLNETGTISAIFREHR